MENEPVKHEQLHDSQTNKNIWYYAAKWYYKSALGRDEYSCNIAKYKDRDLNQYFWPNFKGTLEFAIKHQNEHFDYTASVPKVNGLYSPTLLSLQKRIEEEYKILPLHILKKKPGAKKQTDCKDAYERNQNAKQYAQIDENESISDSSFLLMDDVKTSGSHILAYGSLLYQRGARNVAAITLGENYLSR